MSTYLFSCPSCQFQYQAQHGQAGEKFACRNCGQRVAIPPGPTVLFVPGNAKTVLGQTVEEPAPSVQKPGRAWWFWPAMGGGVLVVAVVVFFVLKGVGGGGGLMGAGRAEARGEGEEMVKALILGRDQKAIFYRWGPSIDGSDFSEFLRKEVAKMGVANKNYKAMDGALIRVKFRERGKDDDRIYTIMGDGKIRVVTQSVRNPEGDGWRQIVMAHGLKKLDEFAVKESRERMDGD